MAAKFDPLLQCLVGEEGGCNLSPKSPSKRSKIERNTMNYGMLDGRGLTLSLNENKIEGFLDTKVYVYSDTVYSANLADVPKLRHPKCLVVHGVMLHRENLAMMTLLIGPMGVTVSRLICR